MTTFSFCLTGRVAESGASISTRSRPRSSGVRRALACLSTVLLLAAVTGCSSFTDVETDLLERDDLDNVSGALTLRAGAFRAFNGIVPLFATWSGLLTDELTFTGPAPGGSNVVTDSRKIEDVGGTSTSTSSSLASSQDVQVFVDEAITAMRRHAPEPASRIGDLFALRGYTLLLLAEHFCSGIANVSVEGGQPVPGPSRTTDELLELALAAFDTAAALADGDTSVAGWAALGQGRALLNLGLFADAAAAAATVPTGFVREISYSSTNSQLGNTAVFWFSTFTAADREGGNGLPFVSADDPRLALASAGEEDGVTSWRPAKWADPSLPFVLADGIEARLIEAESALQSGNVAGWLTVHNSLRATQALPPLVDPGTPDARVDLHFEERAFWLFLTGHRLGDLRRLIRQYARNPEDVFPTGVYNGGPEEYGSSTSFPANAAERTNPQFTGCRPDA